MSTDNKQTSQFWNKIKKGWNLPNDKFENLLEQTYTQLSKSLFDDMATLDSLSQELENDKHTFKRGEFTGIDTDFSETIYDNKYELLKRWIINKKIEVEADFSYNLLMINYQLKNWVNQDYHVEYLERNLAELDKALNMEEYLENEDNPVYHINNCFRNGDYPDIEKFKHHDISITMSIILLKQFLKEQLSELNSTIKQNDVFQIKGSFKSEEDKEGNLLVTLPIKQVIELVKKEMKKESPKETKIEKKGDLKYYTAKQVCEMLQVSLQTLNQWRKDGIIVASRIANKPIRYAEQEIQNAVKKISVTPFN